MTNTRKSKTDSENNDEKRKKSKTNNAPDDDDDDEDDDDDDAHFIQNMAASKGKPAWKRVSTRQWIRDIRDCLAKLQSFPYKPICGIFFITFGYYQDMVPIKTYENYQAKQPLDTRTYSSDSGKYGAKEKSRPSKSRKSQKSEPSGETSLPDGDTGLAAATATESRTDMEDSAAARKRSTKGKAVEEMESEPEIGGLKNRKGKGMKSQGSLEGKKLLVSAVSGNLSYDAHVYDLTTLTVMNIPVGTDVKKLRSLFPGAKVTMEGDGNATVKFASAAEAEPFFTNEVIVDGESLVVSPKLK